MLNKKVPANAEGSRCRARRRRWPAGVQPGFRDGSRRQAAGSLSWIGVDDPSELQRLQADHAARMQEPANFQLGGPEKLTSAHDPQHALQKNGGLADQWHMDDGDIMCHPILVLLFLQDFEVANARVGAERNPLKTGVIYYVNDLDSAPPEWRIHDVQSMAKVSTVTAGSITLGVAVKPRQYIDGPALGQGRRHSSNARTR